MAKLTDKQEQCKCKDGDNVYTNGCQICIENHRQMERDYIKAKSIDWANLARVPERLLEPNALESIRNREQDAANRKFNPK